VSPAMPSIAVRRNARLQWNSRILDGTIPFLDGLLTRRGHTATARDVSSAERKKFVWVLDTARCSRVDHTDVREVSGK